VELKEILESIVFSAQKPMSIGELRTVLRDTPEKLPDEKHTSEFATATARAVEKALEELVVEHDNANRSYRLACVGGNWQFVTRPDFAPWLQVLVGAKPRPPKLSQPALETLAIVAYRQPITRAEMEQIRGVAVDGVVATLVERELIEIKGEAEAPGRPKLYGTTQFFLEHFGLKSLEELPAAEELRRIYNHEVETSTSTFDLVPRTVEEQRAWIREREGALGVLVAEVDGRIVGFSSLSPYRNRPAYNTTVENSVYVDAGARGLGVGKALLNEIVAMAKARGFHTVIAHISDTEGASVALHQACGFKVVGVQQEVGRKFGRWLDVTVMQHML